MSGSNDWVHLSRIAEVEIEWTTLDAFLGMVCQKVVGHLASDDMTRVCGVGSVLIRVFQEMVRKWFDMGIFPVLRRTYRKPILGFSCDRSFSGG